MPGWGRRWRPSVVIFLILALLLKVRNKVLFEIFRISVQLSFLL
jgi:hypothetical protein